MRKVMFLLFCVFALVSCEQEEVWSELQIEGDKNEMPLTRSANDVPAALDQLDGVPVYIKSVYSNKYLSAISNDGGVGLVDKDDGSLRQRWIIKRYPYIAIFPYNIYLLGGIDINDPQLVIGTYKGKHVPFIQENINFGTGRFNFISSSVYSYKFTTGPEEIEGSFPFPGEITDSQKAKIYIQPKSLNSQEIEVADNYYKGDKVKWDIIPVDNFRVEEITYDLTTDDNLSVIPTQIATKTLVNDTDVPATRTLAFQETVTNESSFSELMGLKMTDKISATHKVGIAKFLNGEYTMETTTEQTWNFTMGEKETQSYTISETVTQEVPPRTTIEAKLMATKYNATMTYIAKLYGINCGKTIYLKGKWNGAIVQESKIVLTQKGKVLKTIKLER